MPGWRNEYSGTEKTRVIHVVPVDDLREHVEVGDACWCKPKVERVERPFDNGLSILITHNAADGRELVERHGLQ